MSIKKLIQSCAVYENEIVIRLSQDVSTDLVAELELQMSKINAVKTKIENFHIHFEIKGQFYDVVHKDIHWLITTGINQSVEEIKEYNEFIDQWLEDQRPPS